MKTLVFLILSLPLLFSAEPGVEGNQFSVSISGSDGKPVPDSQISLITNDGMIRQKGVAGADGLFTFEKPNKSSVLFAAAPYHESARLRYEGQGIVLMTLKASPDKSSIISEGWTRLLGREGYIYPCSKTFMRSDGIRFRKKETQVTYSVGGIIIATDTKGERFKIYVKEAIHPIYLIEYTSPKVSQTRIWDLATRREVAWMTHEKDDNRFARREPNNEPTEGGDTKLTSQAPAWPTIRLGSHSSKSDDGRWVTFNVGGDPLFDARTGRKVDVVQHDGNISDAVFSPSGRWLATASDDQTVRVWPLRTDDLVAEAMPRLQRNLTFDEWEESFDDQPYPKTCPDLPVHPSVLEAGRQLAKKGDIDGAAAIFRRVVELEPNSKLDPKTEARRLFEGAKEIERKQEEGQPQQ